MQKTIKVSTHKHNELIDITEYIHDFISENDVETGSVMVYVQGATAGIMIQENWDDSVQSDVIDMLNKIAPQGLWKHDRIDNNGAAHLKSGLVGPSECIPVIVGKAGLSTWQNVFLCEFDGPRKSRKIVLTLHKSR
ncbi:MAG: secondary thiamine-phosphate synthase enzyme YjbQ [Bacteroidota bacterium]|nr:secondary thiamine-phosphate synthase enzyme YjbQ [Bacteroidota bacterium]